MRKIKGVMTFYLILGAFCLGMAIGAKLLHISIQAHSDEINQNVLDSHYKKNVKKDKKLLTNN